MQSKNGRRIVETDFAAEKFDAMPPRSIRPRQVSAFLTVQEGCDKFCTFCVVPYTRGAEFSRPVAQVVAEAEELAREGRAGADRCSARTSTPITARATAGHGRWRACLHRLANIPGIARLRYTTSHPRDMSDDLIAAHRDLPALMPYLHLPVQSGSDRVLKQMNRRHGRDAYLRLVERLRRARPDLALSGDFIVGFPGESEADFEDTLRLVEEVGYASAFPSNTARGRGRRRRMRTSLPSRSRRSGWRGFRR